MANIRICIYLGKKLLVTRPISPIKVKKIYADIQHLEKFIYLKMINTKLS